MSGACQLPLIAGHYRCQHCGQLVDQVRRVRRFWLCDACWLAYVPAAAAVETVEQQARVTAYWDWMHNLEQRHPVAAARRQTPPAVRSAREDDQYMPVCPCGGLREPVRWSEGASPGLFGGPFHGQCPTCEAKRGVEAMVRMADAVHPDWDDEEWLDQLYRSHRQAFDLGVLPDYWFVLRQRQVAL